MPPLFKLIAISVIWVMISALTIVQMVVSEAQFNWIFTVAIFGIAAGVTNGILTSKTVGDGSENRARRVRESYDDMDMRRPMTGKAKNSQVGGIDPELMALLSDDDLDDLRAEVKEQLRQRILSGADGELSSLDELINNAPRAKRK
ncbi:MAG: hypothetical protein MUF38_13210 [Anaerolineae bacterium]|jgi:hypothetical protein|nr:hypothetical protein [Anaerolineae bacterium]